jgi:hypothetical protein
MFICHLSKTMKCSFMLDALDAPWSIFTRVVVGFEFQISKSFRRLAITIISCSRSRHEDLVPWNMDNKSPRRPLLKLTERPACISCLSSSTSHHRPRLSKELLALGLKLGVVPVLEQELAPEGE